MTHDIPSGSVSVGNPCRVIKSYETCIAESREALSQFPCFGAEYLIGNITEERKQEMLKTLENTGGFII